jgi:predicted nucleic acid-binding protein
VLLVDTNVIVAATDVSAAEHARCAQLLDEHRDLTVTAAVAVESAWMIESRLGRGLKRHSSRRWPPER